MPRPAHLHSLTMMCPFEMQGRLTSANLGDSGFLVLAEKQEHDSVMQIKYHSPQQEHQFGFPYQLGHHENSDSVDDAMLMTLPVSVSLCRSILTHSLSPSNPPPITTALNAVPEHQNSSLGCLALEIDDVR